MQKSILVGALGGDAALKGNEGKQFMVFSIADVENKKNADGSWRKDTTWIDCIAPKSNVIKCLTKGKTVMMTGRFSASAYVNREGKAVAQLKFLVQELQLINSGASGTNSNPVTIINNGTGERISNGDNEDLPF